MTRGSIVTVGLAVVAIVTAFLVMAVGDYPLDPVHTIRAIAEDGFAHTVVVEWRAPRIAAALLFGAALGMSGSVFQSITRNPLGSPDIIGLGAGSYTGALVMMLVAGAGRAATTVGALAGGMIAAGVVFVLALGGPTGRTASRGRGSAGLRLILVGVAVGGMLTSVNTWLLLTSRVEVAQAASAWGIGTLSGIRWPMVSASAVAILVATAVIAMMARQLRVLELGDDLAIALGVRPNRVRLVAGLGGVALTAAVVSVSGPIAFIALAAPHLGRMLTRRPGFQPWESALCGAVVLGLSDLVAQRVIAPAQLPVGVVTVCVGGVFLLSLLLGSRRVPVGG